MQRPPRREPLLGKGEAARDEHGAGGAPDDILGHAPQEEVRRPLATVGADDHQPHVVAAGGSPNVLGGRPHPQAPLDGEPFGPQCAARAIQLAHSGFAHGPPRLASPAGRSSPNSGGSSSTWTRSIRSPSLLANPAAR